MYAAKLCGGGYDHCWRKAEEADGMPRRMLYIGKQTWRFDNIGFYRLHGSPTNKHHFVRA
jgi:hypothetical protein